MRFGSDDNGGSGRPGPGTGWPGSGAGASRPAGRPGIAPPPGAAPGTMGRPGERGESAGWGSQAIAPQTSVGLTQVQEMRRPPSQAPTPVEAPTPTLPKGGGAVQPIAEKFSMNPATGTGSTSVAIATPPGRGGFGPQLAVGYDSGAGNGPFGLGWSLAVPSISRKTDKGIPQYRDIDRSDTFVMSGAEDLVPALKKQGDQWMPDVVIVGDERRERFRPRVEGGFARIERVTHTDAGSGAVTVFWRTTTPDNTVSEYGRSEAARIVKPGFPRQVFRWLLEESRDDKGNVVRYEYKAEDLEGVPNSAHERHRKRGIAAFVNRYLKRLRYGNRVTAPTGASDFAYEVVFDYGEHDAAAPTPDEDTTWPAREDPFSFYRAGFEIRTYRLCRRALVFHRFDAFTEPLPNPLLVRSTDFTYEQSPSLTYLTKATQSGYLWDDIEEEYIATALPPAEFDYSRASFQSEVTDLEGASLRGVTGAIGARGHQWIDLDGEGVPGLLCQYGQALSYKRNLGQGKLGAPQELPSQPTATALGRTGQQLVDVTGNGLPDLVDYGRGRGGFHPRGDDRRWGRMRSFSTLPNVDWSDPRLRFIDLNGDGFADILMSEEDVYVWYPSRREEGFGPGRRVSRFSDENKGPTVVFAEAEQTVFLADMSGDGLQDLVRVRNGSVVYWPNLGHGNFGPKVTMDDAPHMAPDNLYSPARVRLADLDGSGTADLVYLGRGIHIWRNRAGNGFGPEERLAIFPDASPQSTVDLVDLLGTGTSCLVWSTSLQGKTPHLRYVDLLSEKPHLLTRAVNNLGLETRIAYTTSTQFYLEDRAAGVEWATRLPFPVQVCERIEHYDHVSRHRFVSTYRYRHGFYDAEEREFRGFGYVEQRDAESVGEHIGRGLFPDYPIENGEMPRPPAVTKTWFHTGAWQKRKSLLAAYHKEWTLGQDEPRLSMPAMPAGLSPVELHQAHRALAGTMLRQEVYAEDGSAQADRPYVVTQRTFGVRRVQPTEKAPYAVFFTHPSESLSLHYERGTTDPRIVHELTLTVDDLGRATHSAAVAYGRVSADLRQARTWITASQQGFYDFLEEDDAYRHGVPRWSKSWELSGSLTKVGALYTIAELAAALDGAVEVAFDDESLGADRGPPTGKRRLLGHTRHRYWNDAAAAPLDYGDCASKALPFETYALALTGAILDGPLDEKVDAELAKDEGKYLLAADVDGFEEPSDPRAGDELLDDESDLWASTGHATFDAESFFLVERVTDVFGTSTLVTYDADALFVTATTLDLASPLDLSTTAEIDYRVLAPKKVTAIDGSHTRALFDALGRLVETAVGGVLGEGDMLSTDEDSTGPTTEITYSDFDWLNEQKPTWVKTRVRDEHGVTNPNWIESYAYAGGSGQAVLTKVQAEDGLVPKIVDGQVELDEDGNPVLVLEDPPTRWLGSGRTVVDNKGNPIKQYEPYFSPTHLYDADEVFADWGVTPLLHYDPLGRLIRTDFPDGSTSRIEFSPWFQKTYDQNDTLGEPENLWYADKSEHEDALWQDAAEKAVAHSYNDEVETLDPGDEGAWGTPTVTDFDALGRAFRVVEHNRAPTDVFYTTTSSMDVQGNVLVVKDAKGRDCMLYDHGMLGQVLRIRSLDAGRRYMFDAVDGQPVKMWGERGFTQRVEYDAMRRPLGVYVHDGTTEKLVQRILYGEYHEDAGDNYLKGRVVQHYDQSGVVLTEDFDFKGNPKSSSRKVAGNYQSTVDWSHLATTTDPAAALTHTTTVSMLESETWTHTFEYDALNRPTSATTPDGTEVLPTYNKAGLLERVEAKVRGATPTTVFVDSIAYDEKGRRTEIVYSDPNGDQFFTEYSYDPLTYRLEHFKTKRESDDKLLQSLAYYYDPVGNITATKDTSSHDVFFSGGGSIPEADGDYTYDAVYRLIAASGREHADFGGYTDEQDDALSHPQGSTSLREYDEEYAYDQVGNLLSMHHQPTGGGSAWTRNYNYVTYGSGHDDFPNVETNRLETTDDDGAPAVHRNYDHDAHGNMVAMPHLFDLQWDYADQLEYVEIVENDNQEVHFVYDASGQRVRKVWRHGQWLDETLYLGGYEVWRRYISNGGNWDLYDARETVHVSDDARRICMVETQTWEDEVELTSPTPRLRFQLDDHLGTVAVEVDATGNVISYEQYHPYGTSAYRAQDGTLGVSAKRYRYNGKERDDETKLYYYGARYYAPWLGRWTAADPLAFADGVGAYTHVRGSPIVLSDPNGKQSAEATRLREDLENYEAQITQYRQLADPDETDVSELKRLVGEAAQVRATLEAREELEAILAQTDVTQPEGSGVLEAVKIKADAPPRAVVRITNPHLDVAPAKLGLSPGGAPGLSLSPAEHALAEHKLMNVESPYISASMRLFGAKGLEGSVRLWINISTAVAHGAEFVSEGDILADMARLVEQRPEMAGRAEIWMRTARITEREVLFRGMVHPSAIDTAGTRALRVGGYGLQFVGVASTSYHLAEATDKSIEEESAKPIVAQVVREAGGWGGAWLGAKAGAAGAGALGLTTGIGAVATGLAGGLVGGVAGYFGADWIADYIYED
jgi:RHS repeat-associated protein